MSFWSTQGLQRIPLASREAAVAAQQRCLSKGILAWPSHRCGPRPGAAQSSLGSSAGAHPETWPSPHHFSQCPSGPARRPPAAQPHSGSPRVSTRSPSSPRANPGSTRPHCFRGASQAAPATPECLCSAAHSPGFPEMDGCSSAMMKSIFSLVVTAYKSQLSQPCPPALFRGCPSSHSQYRILVPIPKP